MPDGRMDGWKDGWTDRWAFFQPPNDRHFIIVSFGECVIHHANNRSFPLTLLISENDMTC